MGFLKCVVDVPPPSSVQNLGALGRATDLPLKGFRLRGEGRRVERKAPLPPEPD